MLPAMQVLAGSVTAIDRDVRTIALGPSTFTAAPNVSLAGIDVGASISVIYENFDGVLVAVDLVRLPSLADPAQA